MSTIALISFAGSGQAKRLPHWPIDYVVLKSQLVVQGHFNDEQRLVVEKVFFGDAKPLQQIAIVDEMRLSRIADDPYRQCDRIQEKNRSTGAPCRSVKHEPVVVFLERSHGAWQPTAWGSGVKWLVDGRVLGYYQFDNPGPYILIGDYEVRTYDELYRAIETAIRKRAQYEAALADTDPTSRINGLKPFVQSSKKDVYWREAIHSLAATGSTAGKPLRDLAEELKGNYARIEVLKAIGESGDKESTPYLLEIVAATKPLIQERAFSRQMASDEERQTIEEWQTALCSIAGLSDPRALPVLRSSLFDALQIEEFYGVPAQGCIERGLANNPTVENLIAFEKAYELYPKRYRWQGSTGWASWGVLSFLTAHKFIEAIPLLTEQLDHPDPGSSGDAHKLLVDIVKRDLGETKEPWLEWYRLNR